MIKAVATGESKRLNKGFKEIHRLAEEGEIIELTEERFKFLNGDNPYNAVFVEKYNKGKITFLNTEEDKGKITFLNTEEKKAPTKKPAQKKSSAKKSTTKKAPTKKGESK